MHALSRLLLFPFPLAAPEKLDFPVPKVTKPDEPVAKIWSANQAAECLDGVGMNWTRDRVFVGHESDRGTLGHMVNLRVVRGGNVRNELSGGSRVERE